MGDDGERERYDLGVLFVHGIGQQVRGQTLTAWADPVIRWLQLWLGRDPVEVGAAELGPVPEDPAARQHVEGGDDLGQQPRVPVRHPGAQHPQVIRWVRAAT